jgi:hypothetical protein
MVLVRFRSWHSKPTSPNWLRTILADLNRELGTNYANETDIARDVLAETEGMMHQ